MCKEFCVRLVIHCFKLRYRDSHFLFCVYLTKSKSTSICNIRTRIIFRWFMKIAVSKLKLSPIKCVANTMSLFSSLSQKFRVNIFSRHWAIYLYLFTEIKWNQSRNVRYVVYGQCYYRVLIDPTITADIGEQRARWFHGWVNTKFLCDVCLSHRYHAH